MMELAGMLLKSVVQSPLTVSPDILPGVGIIGVLSIVWALDVKTTSQQGIAKANGLYLQQNSV